MARKQVQVSSQPRSNVLSTMPIRGENVEKFQQLLNTSEAIEVINMYPRGEGRFRKIKGYSQITSDTYDYDMSGEMQFIYRFSDHLVFANTLRVTIGFNVFQETRLQSIYLPTGAVTIHKTYNPDSVFDVTEYGDYLIISNGLSEIDYLTFDLGAELVVPANWTSETFGTNNPVDAIAVRDDGSFDDSLLPTQTAGEFKISNPITVTAGNRYRIDYTVFNYSTFRTYGTLNKLTFDGCFSETSLVYGNIGIPRSYNLTALSTDTFNVNVNQLIGTGGTSTDTAAVPVGTIDGANTEFRTDRYYGEIDNVTIDGSVQTGNTLEGRDLTTSSAPATTLTLNGEYIDNPLTIRIGVKQLLENTLVLGTLEGSPPASVVFAQKSRLYAANIGTSTGEIRYSSTDDGSNPPFSGETKWEDGTDPDDPGQIITRKLIDVKDINAIGDQIIAFGSNGRFGFRVSVSQAGDVPVKEDIRDFEQTDYGGERGTVITPYGIVYGNESGFYLQEVGPDSNIPYSSTASRISDNLGDFSLYDNTDMDVIYEPELEAVVINTKYNGSNIVKAYFFKKEAWVTLEGETDYPYCRMFYDKKTNKAYGCTKNGSKIFEIFNGNSADGSALSFSLKQEVSAGALPTRKSMKGQDYQGELNGSSITVSFDKIGEDGVTTSGIVTQTWDSDRAGGSSYIRHFERLIMNVSGASTAAVTLNYMNLEFQQRNKSRNRKLNG